MPAQPVPQSVAAALPPPSVSRARSAIAWPWVAVHLLLGLVWVALLAFHPFAAFAADQPPPLRLAKMLLLGGWLPSVALAVWQSRHRRRQDLLASDLLAAGIFVLLLTPGLFLPLLPDRGIWFVPFALLPRGLLSEALWRRFR